MNGYSPQCLPLVAVPVHIEGFPMSGVGTAFCNSHGRREYPADRMDPEGLPDADSLFAAMDGYLDVGLVEVTSDCEVIRANSWWSRFPLPVETLVGTNMEGLLVDTAGDWGAVRNAWAARGDKCPLVHEFLLRCDGNPRVWLELTCRRTRCRDGSVGFFATARDISRLRTEQEEVRRLLERERELNSMKSSFVTMVVHEFRNPLTAIVCATEVLRLQAPSDGGGDASDCESYLKAILRSTDRMCHLMDELLLLGKIESGGLRFRPVKVTPAELCDGLRRELGTAELQQRVVIVNGAGADEPADLDPTLLRHTLGNLLSNALKYSPATSHVTFSVRLVGDELWFSVADQGIGVPRQDQQRLFQAFFRASNVGTIKGTGMGLNIAHQCARLHGGSLECLSEAGSGSTFMLKVRSRCEISNPAESAKANVAP